MLTVTSQYGDISEDDNLNNDTVVNQSQFISFYFNILGILNITFTQIFKVIPRNCTNNTKRKIAISKEFACINLGHSNSRQTHFDSDVPSPWPLKQSRPARSHPPSDVFHQPLPCSFSFPCKASWPHKSPLDLEAFIPTKLTQRVWVEKSGCGLTMSGREGVHLSFIKNSRNTGQINGSLFFYLIFLYSFTRDTNDFCTVIYFFISN